MRHRAGMRGGLATPTSFPVWDLQNQPVLELLGALLGVLVRLGYINWVLPLPPIMIWFRLGAFGSFSGNTR